MLAFLSSRDKFPPKLSNVRQHKFIVSECLLGAGWPGPGSESHWAGLQSHLRLRGSFQAHSFFGKFRFLAAVGQKSALLMGWLPEVSLSAPGGSPQVLATWSSLLTAASFFKSSQNLCFFKKEVFYKVPSTEHLGNLTKGATTPRCSQVLPRL